MVAPAAFPGPFRRDHGHRIRAPLPKGLEPGALRTASASAVPPGNPLPIVKDVPEVSRCCAGTTRPPCGWPGLRRTKGFIVVEGQALAYVPIDFSSTDDYLSRLSKSRRKNLRRKLKSRERLDIEAVPLGDARFGSLDVLEEAVRPLPRRLRPERNPFRPADAGFLRGLLQKPGARRRGILLPP